jgi:8-oxo-dGTP pyrophosphatase MutT (NUDIX family)
MRAVPPLPTALTVEDVAARLAHHRARTATRLWPRCAVAVILRQRAHPEVLLMQRAIRAGDRWSGHVSLPGGRHEAHDVDLLATAIRETREEVGIDLATTARPLGQIAPAWAMTRGLPLPMTVTPFVFAVAAPVTIALGDEATAAFWLPIDAAAAGALDDIYVHRTGPLAWKLPCWRHEGRVVWGLTFEMLSRLFALVR